MKTKTATDIRERIAVRAYLMWEKHYQAGVVNAVLPGNDLGYWLAAERIEIGLEAEREIKRKAASRQGVATRRANAAAKTPVAALAAKRKPSATRATAH